MQIRPHVAQFSKQSVFELQALNRVQTFGQDRVGEMEEDGEFGEAEGVAGVEDVYCFGIAGIRVNIQAT